MINPLQISPPFKRLQKDKAHTFTNTNTTTNETNTIYNAECINISASKSNDNLLSLDVALASEYKRNNAPSNQKDDAKKKYEAVEGYKSPI